MRHASKRATEEDVNRRDAWGRSPLHRAAMEGDVRRVRELVAGGADTRLRGMGGETPLHCALWKGEEEAAELLADVDSGNDVEDRFRQTPLHRAAVLGHVGVVRKLLAGGARTRARDIRDETPLHSALKHEQLAAAELIVEADSTIELRDLRGRTPLHLAAKAGFSGIVATLLRNDPDPHIGDDEGYCALRLALGRGRRGDVPGMILARYALKGFAVDWAELGLEPHDQQFCLGELSLCSEEIRLMKETRVGASSVTYHDLVTWHASRVAPRLRSGVPRDRRERDFPRYAEPIALGLRSAEERRVWMDHCLRSFSLLPPELPPFPVTCTDVVLLCLSDADMERFVRAVPLPSREQCSGPSTASDPLATGQTGVSSVTRNLRLLA